MSEKFREPCSFGWEMARDKDLNSWEIVGNLLKCGKQINITSGVIM